MELIKNFIDCTKKDLRQWTKTSAVLTKNVCANKQKRLRLYKLL